MGYLEKIRQGAKAASYELGVASTKEKDEALLAMAQELIIQKRYLKLIKLI